MSPTLVEMVALITGGLVGTRPDGGGVTGLTDGSCEAGYWQFTPRSGGGANAGSGGTGPLVGPAPGLGALVRLGAVFCAVELLAPFAGPWPLVTSVMTNAITA